MRKRRKLTRFGALLLAGSMVCSSFPVQAAELPEAVAEMEEEQAEAQQSYSLSGDDYISYTMDDWNPDNFSPADPENCVTKTGKITTVDGTRVNEGIPGEEYLWVPDGDITFGARLMEVFADGLTLSDEEQSKLLAAAENGTAFAFVMPENEVAFGRVFVKAYRVSIEASVVGGTVEIENPAPIAGETVAFEAVPEEGYRFAGWKSIYTKYQSINWTLNLETELDLPASEAANSFTVPLLKQKDVASAASTPIKLVPQFEEIEGTQFTVTFTTEDGEGEAPAGLQQKKGDTFLLPENSYTYAGYLFAGWSDGTQVYQPGDSYTMPHKAVTFTALWRDNNLNDVYFRAEEGAETKTLGIDAQLPGAVFTLPKNSFTHSGTGAYEFTGWSDGTAVYQPGDTYTMGDEPVIFTAQWKQYYRYTVDWSKAGKGTMYYDYTLLPEDPWALYYLKNQKRVPEEPVEKMTWGLTYYQQPTYVHRFDGITVNGTTYTEDTVLEESDFFSGTVKVHITGTDAPGENGYTYGWLEFLDGSFTGDVTVTPVFTQQLQLSNTAEIKSISVGDANGVIDRNKILIRLGDDADLTNVRPDITVSDGAAVVPGSGEAQDFTDPVIYTVTSKNGKVTRSYQVTVVKLRDTVTEAMPSQIAKGIASNQDGAGKILGKETLLSQVSSTNSDWVAFGMGRYSYVQPDGSVWMLYEDNEGREAFLEAMKAYMEKMYAENDGVLSFDKATEWQRAILAIAALGGDPTNFGTYQGEPINLVADGTYNCKITPGKQGVNGEAFALIAKNTLDYEIPDSVQYSDEYLITSIMSKQLRVDGRYVGWDVRTTATTSDPDMTGMIIQALAPYYWDDTEYTYENIKTGETLTKSVRQIVDEALDALGELQTEYGDFICYGDRNVESTVQVLVAVTSLGIDPLTDTRFIKNGNTLIDGIQNFGLSSGGYEHMLGGGWNYMATDQGNYGMIAAWRYFNGMRNLYDMRPEFTDEQKAQIQSVKDTIDAALAKKGQDGYYEALAAAKQTYDEAVAGFEDATLRNYITNYWELVDALADQDDRSAEVTAQIDAIGTVTLQSEAAVRAAREAYDKLTDSEKERVTNYQVLEDAEKALADLQKAEQEKAAFASGKPSVKTQSAGYNSVKISWNAYENTDSYLVYRKTKGTSFKRIAAVTGLSYTDQTAVTGTTYYYTVKAASKYWGSTVYSKYETNVTGKAMPAKSAITKTQSWGYNKAKITWNKVSGASGYRLYYKTSANGAWKYVTQIGSGSTVSYVHAGLTSGRTYYYMVRAYRTVSGTKHFGAYSNVMSAKPVPVTTKISNVTAGNRQAKVTWGKVSGASGYRLYYRTSKNGTWKYVTQISNGNTTSYTHKGLTKGQTVYYKMRAYRTVSGTKVFGAYSAEKYAKIK